MRQREFVRSPRANPSCWRVIAPRPDRSRKPRACGVKPDSGRWNARRYLKPRSSLFSALFGSWVASHVAFNGDAMRELGAQFLAVAEKQGATAPLLIAHRLMGISLAWTGNIAEGRVHYDQGVALYDPAKHRPLATRFGQDAGVSILCFRSLALWLLGYHDAALADSERALKDARVKFPETGNPVLDPIIGELRASARGGGGGARCRKSPGLTVYKLRALLAPPPQGARVCTCMRAE
jgi:hypothetical protein